MKRNNNKCYNAGKIGGLPFLVVHQNFARADDKIRKMGMQPVNPLYNGLQNTAPWIFHMAVDLWMLAHCRSVYFQRNWRLSKGARFEFRVAKLLGKEMMFEEEESGE